jgi:predicted RNase H-like HicB family nuclease
MSLSRKITINPTAPQLNYDVVIENQSDGTMKATLLGLPNYQSVGTTEEEALNNLIHIIQERKPKIVTLEIEHAEEAEHPWVKFTGMFKDDPQFDEVMKYIEEHRRELDAEMEDYYKQIDEYHKQNDAEIDEYAKKFTGGDRIAAMIQMKLFDGSMKANKNIEDKIQ